MNSFSGPLALKKIIGHATIDYMMQHSLSRSCNMCTTFPDIKYTQVSTTTYKGPNPQLVRTKSYNRVHLITSRINTSSIKHQLLYSQSYIALHSLQVFFKWTFSLRQITRDWFVYSPNETAARGAAELCPCV